MSFGVPITKSIIKFRIQFSLLSFLLVTQSQFGLVSVIRVNRSGNAITILLSSQVEEPSNRAIHFNLKEILFINKMPNDFQLRARRHCKTGLRNRYIHTYGYVRMCICMCTCMCCSGLAINIVHRAFCAGVRSTCSQQQQQQQRQQQPQQQQVM